MALYRCLVPGVAFLAFGAWADSVSISVNASQSIGAWRALNRYFGCDEPNFAYYPYGQALLNELGDMGKDQTYFRTHNLLTTGNGSLTGIPSLKFGSTNVYTEDNNGSAIYNFTIIDRIFDSYLAANIKPYVQVGFMPLAMVVHPDPYFFNFTPESSPNTIYTGWSHVPKSYESWQELVYHWARHCLERYGENEVLSWYWEIWNEPNIPYWNGTTEQFYMLHDHGIAGIKRAIPQARVGGCEVAGGAAGTFLGDFLTHCISGTNFATHAIGTPLDFISFHAKGSPVWVNNTTTGEGNGHVRMGLATQLQQIDNAFGVVASFPELKDKPIVMGEYDPDGCAACQTAAYGYRNGLLYPAYTATSFMRAVELAQRREVNLEGALTWAFEYEQTPLLSNQTHFFDGFRVLSTMGIDKPVLNAHRMLSMIRGQQVNTTSSGQLPVDAVLKSGVTGNQTDIGAVASVDGNTLYVFVWHYHDDDLAFPDVMVNLELRDLPFSGQSKMTHWRIDDEHSNSYSEWLRMGSPQPPSDEQYQHLQITGKLTMLEEPQILDVAAASLSIEFVLPIRALSLLVFERA